MPQPRLQGHPRAPPQTLQMQGMRSGWSLSPSLLGKEGGEDSEALTTNLDVAGVGRTESRPL